MKTFIRIMCSCGQQVTIETTGSQPLRDKQCPHCQLPIWFVEGTADFVSIRIFQRSLVEFNNGDFTLAIALGAMAVECELARQFVKWNALDFAMANDVGNFHHLDKTPWVDQWRKLQTISTRLDKLSELLTKQTFDTFVAANIVLLKPLHDKYSATKTYVSAKELVQKEFFYRRNRIVHYGEIDFQSSDAESCLMIGGFMFQTIKAMDQHRYKATWPDQKGAVARS